MSMVNAGTSIRGGLTTITRNHSTVVLIQADRWSVSISASTDARFPTLPSDPDHQLLAELHAEATLLTTPTTKTPLPPRTLSGLRAPIWVTNNNAAAFREIAVGWPFRCLLVRGRAARAGPFSWKDLRATVREAPGWSINLSLTSLSIATFGGPVFALLLIPRVIRHYRRRRAGDCPTCGYDLTGTPTSNPVCPECGTPISTTPKSPT